MNSISLQVDFIFLPQQTAIISAVRFDPCLHTNTAHRS